MSKKITTQEVKEKLDSKTDFYLIDTLATSSFEARHIPGAISVPYSTNFAQEFEEKVGARKDSEIIAYCASSGCQLSSLAATALEEAGYTHVGHYVDGLAGWLEAKHSIEEETRG